MKILSKLEIERIWIQSIYEKPTANIILNTERLTAFVTRLGVRQGSHTSFKHHTRSPSYCSKKKQNSLEEEGKIYTAQKYPNSLPCFYQDNVLVERVLDSVTEVLGIHLIFATYVFCPEKGKLAWVLDFPICTINVILLIMQLWYEM